MGMSMIKAQKLEQIFHVGRMKKHTCFQMCLAIRIKRNYPDFRQQTRADRNSSETVENISLAILSAPLYVLIQQVYFSIYHAEVQVLFSTFFVYPSFLLVIPFAYIPDE